MARLYLSAPQDEVQLARQARPWVEALNGALPDATYLGALNAEHGTDLATMVFYHATRAANTNKAFVDALDVQAINTGAQSGVKLLVLPAMFHQEHPEVGGDGAHILEVARACGINAQRVPTLSKGGIVENTPIILNALQNERAERIWIMTLSKGAAELRAVLHNHREQIPLERIQVWFNVGGLPHGADMVDLMLSSALRRIKTRALCTLTGVDFDSFAAFGTDNPQWQYPLNLPNDLRVINIVGAPLASHLQRALHARYLRLKHLGPNDGMVVLPRALWLPGQVYPVLGADHFFRGTQISALLYRLFAYMLEQTGTCAHDSPTPQHVPQNE